MWDAPFFVQASFGGGDVGNGSESPLLFMLQVFLSGEGIMDWIEGPNNSSWGWKAVHCPFIAYTVYFASALYSWYFGKHLKYPGCRWTKNIFVRRRKSFPFADMRHLLLE